MPTLEVQFFQVGVVLLLGPLVTGAIARAEAIVQQRRGPRLLQPHHDIAKRLSKETVRPSGAGPVFRAAPYLSFSAGLGIALVGVILLYAAGTGALETTYVPHCPVFLAAALALSGVPLSGVFRSEFQIVAGGLDRPAYGWVAALIVLVNLAFLGVIWHAGKMVLSRPAGAPGGETSRRMVAPMLACLVLVVGLGLHLPGSLSQLLSLASHSLAHPSP